MSSEEIVQVFRIIRYVGPRKWVESTLAKSVQGRKEISSVTFIEGHTINIVPEVISTMLACQECGATSLEVHDAKRP